MSRFLTHEHPEFSPCPTQVRNAARQNSLGSRSGQLAKCRLCRQAVRTQNVAAEEAAVQLDTDGLSEKERLAYERLAQEIAVRRRAPCSPFKSTSRGQNLGGKVRACSLGHWCSGAGGCGGGSQHWRRGIGCSPRPRCSQVQALPRAAQRPKRQRHPAAGPPQGTTSSTETTPSPGCSAAGSNTWVLLAWLLLFWACSVSEWQ